MEREKLIKALVSAILYLEKSKTALVKLNEKGLLDYVWRAAADSEYALFLFSIMHQENGSSWKSTFSLKKVEMEPALKRAQALIKGAKESIEANDYHTAHKKTWMARSYLMKVQNIFKKRQS